jgi:hypothetical protein
VALEEFERFFADRKEQIISRLAQVKDPGEAFAAALEYRTLTAFISEARAAVALGSAADKKIKI